MQKGILLAPIGILLAPIGIEDLVSEDLVSEWKPTIFGVVFVLSILVAPAVWRYTFLVLKRNVHRGVEPKVFFYTRIGLRFAAVATVLWMTVLVAVCAITLFVGAFMSVSSWRGG
jgi:hypothetical protein